MFDGLPLEFFEQGHDGDGGVAEHEQGKAQQAQELACPAAADASVLCQQGQGADEEEGGVCAENRCDDGLDQPQPPARQIATISARYFLGMGMDSYVLVCLFISVQYS